MNRTRSALISAVAIGLLAGSAVGVAAQDEAADPMAPAAFSGSAEGGEEPQFLTDPDTGLDLVVIDTFELTDPRASGTWSQIEDFANMEGGLNYGAGGSSVRLANDGGAWVGTLRLVTSRDASGEGTVGGLRRVGR